MFANVWDNGRWRHPSRNGRQNFSYDTFGNITKTVPNGNTGTTFQPGYGSGNWISGFGYDGMGDVTSDGTYTYAYDGRVAQPTILRVPHPSFLCLGGDFSFSFLESDSMVED